MPCPTVNTKHNGVRMKSFKRLNLFFCISMGKAMAKGLWFVSISLKCLFKIHQSLRIVEVALDFIVLIWKKKIEHISISEAFTTRCIKLKRAYMCNALINLAFSRMKSEETFKGKKKKEMYNIPMWRYHAAYNNV